MLYGDHPYGRLFPTEAALQGYTIAQVRDFYDKNYGAGRSHLYVAGRFDAAAMEAAIRKGFGDWKRGAAPQIPPASPKSSRAVYILDRPGAVQSTILMGMPVIDPSKPDWDALFLMNVLLGGSFASRITSNIREAKGYTYSPNGQLSNRYHDAYWAEAADVTTNVTGPAVKEIFGEVDRLQAEPPSDKELKGFQNYRAGVFILQNSSRGGIIGQLEFVDLHGLPADYLNGYVKRLYAITPRAGAADGQEVHPGRQGHDRRRRRQEGHRGAAEAVRTAEVGAPSPRPSPAGRGPEVPSPPAGGEGQGEGGVPLRRFAVIHFGFFFAAFA